MNESVLKDELLANIARDTASSMQESEDFEINFGFLDLVREELEFDDLLEEDELLEGEECLDAVITEYDEKKAEQTTTDIDEFLLQTSLETNDIIEEQKEQAMEELYDFFDEDAEIFEESVDVFLEETEEVEDKSFEDDLDSLDAVEGDEEYYEDEEEVSIEEV